MKHSDTCTNTTFFTLKNSGNLLVCDSCFSTAPTEKGGTCTDTTNPKDLIGIKKVQMHLVPASSIIYQALAMEDGGVKYGPFNWRQKKVIASVYISACQRHLAAWFDGENDAEDSGKPHLAHAIACLGIIIDSLETGNLIDDRPAKGASAELLKRFQKG